MDNVTERFGYRFGGDKSAVTKYLERAFKKWTSTRGAAEGKGLLVKAQVVRGWAKCARVSPAIK